MNMRLAWVRIAVARKPGLQAVWRMVEAWGSPEAVIRASLPMMRTQLGPARGRAAHAALRAARPERVLRRAREAGQSVLTPDDAAYPRLDLEPLSDPPAALFLRGMPLCGDRAVGVVGARKAGPYGLEVAATLSADLARRGVCVVSGLALGVDGAAHDAAVQEARPDEPATVAFLGCGIDVAYPSAHAGLAERIARYGTLASEHPPGERPERWHFPRRNRLIAALSRAVVVVQAGTRSGALVTARVGGHLGRETLAVPGPVGTPLSAGCHRLLRQGAGLCESVDDIFEALGWDAADNNTTPPFAPTGDAASIWQLLDVHRALDLDALCRTSGLAPETVAATLTDWELDGRVQRLPGVGFRKRLS